MGLGGCYSCIKYMMFAFNFLFWLLGCAILGVGIWVRVDPNFKTYIDLSGSLNYLYTGAYILIIVGLIMMLIGFLGCCGAIRESQCMLFTFFICLFIIFACLLVAGIMAIVAKRTLKKSVSDRIKEAVRNYYNTTSTDDRALMDTLHEKFHCCGANGSDDYTRGIPGSCDMQYYINGCEQAVFDFFADNLIIIAGVAIGIGVIMVFDNASSLYLFCRLSRKKVKRSRSTTSQPKRR